MKRLAPRMAKKREMKKKRMATGENLEKRARKAALKIVRTRVAGKVGANYVNLSVSQKMAIDKIVEKHSGKVAALARKLLPKVKVAEKERLKSFRLNTNQNEQTEVTTSKPATLIPERTVRPALSKILGL
jgi:hypothetical protein